MIINNNKLVANNSRIISIDNFDSMTTAYVSGMTTKLDYLHIRLIDKFVVTVKSILQKADVVYLGNINNSNDSFRNLVKDAHHGTIQGTGLVFDPYWGWSNPEGTGYINTNYNPATQGINFQQNSAYVGVYKFGNNTDNYNNSMVIGQERNTKMYLYYAINGGSFDGKGILPFDNGLHSMRRLSSTQSNFLNQNIDNTVKNYNSVIPHSSNFYIYRESQSPAPLYPYNKGLSFVYIGGGLNDAEHKQLNDAINDYLIQCLFLKYGQDNWGVKMAKSYFLELHNFEKYEAWEVYEFIKRHQGNYYESNIIPTASSNFDTDGTSWWSNAYSNLVWNSIDYCAKIVCNSVGNARIYKLNNTSIIPNSIYRVRFKYRSSNVSTKALSVYLNSTNVGAQQTNLLSTEWQQYDNLITAITDDFSISLLGADVGDEYEVDDIIVEPFAYLYNTFGLSGQNKTVADYILLFKAGGNLISRSWIKSGSYLRWNLDGEVYNTNVLPSYTRGGNLGIVTVTSIDGWNGVTKIQLIQTSNNVNSFYGNMPKFVGTLKTGGSKAELYLRYNRMKIDLRNQPLSLLSSVLNVNQTNTGYNKLNISDLVGGSYTLVYTMGKRYNPNGNVIGDVSLLTNEITRDFYIRHDYDIYGHFYNYNTSTLVNFYADYTSVSGGFSTWSNTISLCSFDQCMFDTTAVDDQLRVINNYYSIATPIKDLKLYLGGSTMGIPTGGANNSDLLGIVAKHSAAGFTATITVRTV